MSRSKPMDRLVRTIIDAMPSGAERMLSRAESESIMQRTKAFARGDGRIRVEVKSEWSGELRWARNRVSLASDRRDVWVSVWRERTYNEAIVRTNQLDDVSLEAAVRFAERMAQDRLSYDMEVARPALEMPATAIWSDATYAVTSDTRGQIAERLAADAERRGMLSAGYLEMRADTFASSGPYAWVGAAPAGVDAAPADMVRESPWFYQRTEGQCSMTVRHPGGRGSGWAGLSGYDWSAIDGPTLAARALDKCVSSIDPVVIEPGRYTVVLEPQAVYDLVSRLMPLFDRTVNEGGSGPFAVGMDEQLRLIRTKLGLKIADERVTLSHDPSDPRMGVAPEPGLRPVTWIKNGVLTAFDYERERYSISSLNHHVPSLQRAGFHLSGGTTPVDEMIATTKRGLLVTRFSNLAMLDVRSVLHTGVTRDGLWLIENGKISKAVKNLRITESPLFMLNQIVDLGVPVPVFCPGQVAIVPPIKANDFSFTSLVDAV